MEGGCGGGEGWDCWKLVFLDNDFGEGLLYFKLQIKQGKQKYERIEDLILPKTKVRKPTLSLSNNTLYTFVTRQRNIKQSKYCLEQKGKKINHLAFNPHSLQRRKQWKESVLDQLLSFQNQISLIIIMLQGSINQLPVSSENSLQSSSSPQTAKIPILTSLDVFDKEEQAQSCKNRRWNDHEHILYILFLEQNRQKIKSRFIRRSNSFFKQMQRFIETKSSTQCRSYHQKYEAKYKFPHRIIREEREKLDPAAYSALVEKVRQKAVNEEREAGTVTAEKGKRLPKKQKVETHEYSCQTIIEGISTVFLQQDLPQNTYRQQSYPNFSLYSFPVGYSPMTMCYSAPSYSYFS